jgi:hypothetical protein
MNVVLYPRVAPSDRVRVWIGVFQVTQAPAITWTINQEQRDPTILREIASVRPDNMLLAQGSPATVPRAFTGVYEFSGLEADSPYEITATVDGTPATLRTRTLPNEIPQDLDRWFNVLLVSCFHQAEDRGGLAGTIVSQLSAISKPHLTLLAGDQVYLDLPTLREFENNTAWLAQKFEEDYTLNWAGPLAYTEVLKAAPSVSVPDDHEYWNNFPHHCTIINNTYSDEGQRRWELAARTVFEGFQRQYPFETGDPFIIDVDPLSFFLADTRSNKDRNLAQTMSDASRQKLDEWVTRVIEEERFGVFLSGQSLLRGRAHHILGVDSDYAVDDYELPDYGDYPEIVRSLKRLEDAGRPVLLLTGDVHWGRVAKALDNRTGRVGFWEVISSPASLVSNFAADRPKIFINVLGGLIGKKKDWPRHSDPELPPVFFASEVLDGNFPCKSVYPQRGNHVVMLGFRRHAGGVELRIKYWPISLDKNIGQPVELKPIDLSNA